MMYTAISSLHSFPILRESFFRHQYERFYAEPNAQPGKNWLGILNMVFAIASRYCFLAGMNIQQGHKDTIFYTRAVILKGDSNTVSSNPDLQLVQLETLFSFYLMITSEVNR
jgi:hypothetical protein